jgi:hypothetical protein
MKNYSKYKKNPTLLEQFRSFCYQNNIADLDKAIKYFSIFGGMSWDVDTSVSLDELIEKKVLENYKYIHADITQMTQSDKVSHALLSGAATGDGRIHSALKKARLSRREAEAVIDELVDEGFVELEYSLESPPEDKDKIDEKLYFTKPFYRFWFSCVSPYFKGIKAKEYAESMEQFKNREQELYEFTFKQLAKELLKKTFDDKILEIGSYWDRDISIDILAKTKKQKVVAGICKYSTQKAKKTELNKLKEQCKKAELTPDISVIISKSGFSSELKNLKSDSLKLMSLKNFQALVENLQSKDFIECNGKKY